MFRRVGNAFLTGLFVLLPAITTIYLLWIAFQWVDGLLAKPVENWFGNRIPGLGLFLVLFVITLTGILASHYLFKGIFNYFNHLVEKIPLVGGIYGTVKQITEAFTTKDKSVFRSVVLVEYPRKGVYSAGFLVGETISEIKERNGRKYLQVFIPTVPNPTTGFLINVPEDEIEPVDLSVEEAFKYFISVGVVKPKNNDRLRFKKETK